ncbi:hypothetical protein SNE40_018943 [Patella caerulea]|uniref:Uncharacterized protein n=1 Tax=Patella caerulea TaxID=87958 RepID=A0AAN8J9K5_PATCE
MWILKASLVFVMVLSVFAATPCCIDREFEADTGVIGSSIRKDVFHPIEGFNTMSYDSHNQMVNIQVTVVVNGNLFQNKILMNYNTKREYVIRNGHCTVYELNAPIRDPCIPADATYLRSPIYGYGSNTLEADTWEYVSPVTGAFDRFSVTKDSCIPLVLAQYNPNAPLSDNTTQTDLVLIYSNFRVGIKDRKVFSVPESCANQPLQKPVGPPVF